MDMKVIAILICSWLLCCGAASAQEGSVQHIPKLEINKKKHKVFSGRDSSITLIIDTLVMKNRAKLVFYGKKKVNLKVKYADIEKDAFILGTDGKNNGSDMDITMRFAKLGSLWVSAAGDNAMNGSKTYPNGNGGDIVFKYLKDGVIPQQDNKRQTAYLTIETKAGGYAVNAQSDIRNILDRIGKGNRPLRQLPQGQVYSGSPGMDGKSEVRAVTEF